MTNLKIRKTARVNVGKDVAKRNNKAKALRQAKALKVNKPVQKQEQDLRVIVEAPKGHGGRKPFTDEEYILDIRRVSQLLGYTDANGNHLRFKKLKSTGKIVKETMTAKEYSNHGVFSAIGIKKRFGSFATFRDTYAGTKGRTTPTDRMFDKENNRTFRAIKSDRPLEACPGEYAKASRIPFKMVIRHYGDFDKVVKAHLTNDQDATIH